MPSKLSVVLQAKVGKVFKRQPWEAEKIEIEVEGADTMYGELHIANVFADEHGNQSGLKVGDVLQVIVTRIGASQADNGALNPAASNLKK